MWELFSGKELCGMWYTILIHSSSFICTLEMFHTFLTDLLPGCLWRRVNLFTQRRPQSTFFLSGRATNCLWHFIATFFQSLGDKSHGSQGDVLQGTPVGIDSNRMRFCEFLAGDESGRLVAHFTFLSVIQQPMRDNGAAGHDEVRFRRM